MKKYLLSLLLSTFTFTGFSQDYTSNSKLITEKENQLAKLEKNFEVDSTTFTSIIYGLDKQILKLESEKDSVEEFLNSIKPTNYVYGIIKKNISITNRENQNNHIFDEGDTVQLINHSQKTYTLYINDDENLTINTKYIKPIHGRKKTTSLIAQYQNKLEDYHNIVEQYPTQDWFQYDIKRVHNEKEKYEHQLQELIDEIKKSEDEIKLLRYMNKTKTTS